MRRRIIEILNIQYINFDLCPTVNMMFHYLTTLFILIIDIYESEGRVSRNYCIEASV